mmetsp:Transcript_21182/g.69943  ORF Transcript_21182/g.69943 Transcript_21182/m.69943 type:complete len:300 (-) Transcript_21182:9-908(-)
MNTRILLLRVTHIPHWLGSLLFWLWAPCFVRPRQPDCRLERRSRHLDSGHPVEYAVRLDNFEALDHAVALGRGGAPPSALYPRSVRDVKARAKGARRRCDTDELVRAPTLLTRQLDTPLHHLELRRRARAASFPFVPQKIRRACVPADSRPAGSRLNLKTAVKDVAVVAPPVQPSHGVARAPQVDEANVVLLSALNVARPAEQLPSTLRLANVTLDRRDAALAHPRAVERGRVQHVHVGDGLLAQHVEAASNSLDAPRLESWRCGRGGGVARRTGEGRRHSDEVAARQCEGWPAAEEGA